MPNILQPSVLNGIGEYISFEERTFDDIASEIHCELGAIMVSLTELELKGLIKQTNNKYYKIG